jgi:hypothetical protein
MTALKALPDTVSKRVREMVGITLALFLIPPLVGIALVVFLDGGSIITAMFGGVAGTVGYTSARIFLAAFQINKR